MCGVLQLAYGGASGKSMLSETQRESRINQIELERLSVFQLFSHIAIYSPLESNFKRVASQ